MTSKPGGSPSPHKRKIIWIAAALTIILLTSGYFYYTKSVASQPTQNSQTQPAIIRPGDLTVSASGSGTLIAQTDTSFGFGTSGQVTKVNVKVGDQVEAGQVLAQLDDTLAQMKYEEAQQNLRELYSAASIATIQKEIATAQDTEESDKRWLAYLISPDVAEAEENLAIAQQKLKDAQAAASTNPSDTADKAVMDAEQTVNYLNEVLNQAWASYQKGYLLDTFGVYENIGSRRHPNEVLATTTDPITGKKVPEVNAPSTDDLAIARNNIAQAQETISAGRAYLDILNSGVIPDNAVGAKITTLYNAQLALESAKTVLDQTNLIAPISGTVTSLKLNVGEQVGTDSVITISQLSQPYTLDAYIDAKDWSMAKVGNKVNVAFDLLPDKKYTGTVTLVYPELQSAFESSVVHIVVQLDQAISQDLPVGTGATVSVVGGEANNVLLVPIGAIHDKGNGKYAVTVLQNGQQVEREITIGLKNDTYAEVKSGLEAREIVLTK